MNITHQENASLEANLEVLRSGPQCIPVSCLLCSPFESSVSGPSRLDKIEYMRTSGPDSAHCFPGRCGPQEGRAPSMLQVRRVRA